MVNSSSLLTSSNRETSPPTVCCYNSSNSNILSNTFRNSGGNNSNQNLNSVNNKNQNRSNLIRYNSVSRSGGTQERTVGSSKRNCDNLSLNKSSSKIRVKSDPCLGGLSVNLVQIDDKGNHNDNSHEVVDDGKNHHKLLLLNTKSISGSSSYVIGNSVSAIKNRTAAATVLCKPATTTTTPSTDYSNNFCVNNNSSSSNNNNKTKVNYSTSKNRTKTELPLLLGENGKNNNTTRTTSDKLENLNLLNCFTSSAKVAHNRRRDSRSSSVCLDGISSGASENSLNTSVLSEDLSTDVSLSSSLRKSSNSELRKSSLTINSRNDSIKSDTKIKYTRNGNLVNNKLLPPAITSFKKPTDFQEFHQEINNSDTENKQIICANLNDHANNLNFIDCSSSGEVSLNDDSHIIRPLPPPSSTTTSTPYSASPKRSFLHTIPTVSSPLLTLSNETPLKICANNNQNNIDFNQQNQIKLKEFYEQKTLSTATDLHKFKSNSNNANQHSHVRYKTIASEYPNIGWNPNENYPNNQIFYESVTNNNRNNDQNSEKIKLINNNVYNVPYLINSSNKNQVPATVPRNINSNKSLKYYQSQQINIGSPQSGNNTSQLTKSQQDIQKQVSVTFVYKKGFFLQEVLI